MTQRATATLQHGIWIDQQRLAEAGLQAPLEIAVQPGEIRIRSAASATPGPSAHDPLLDLAGSLSGAPLSGSQVEHELYADEASQP